MKNGKLYEIKAQADGEAEVWLYGPIGPDYWGDGSSIDAKPFCQDLAELQATHISLRVNSPGGVVTHGHAIYNALLRHPAPVTAYVDGIAASAASLVALAGDEVVIAENALYMIHQPYGVYCGYFNSAELRREADVTDKYAESIAVVYQRRTGLSAEEVLALMDAETWYTGQEAVDAGFADRTSEDGGAVALAMSFDFARLGYRHVPNVLRRGGRAQPPRREKPAEDHSGDIDPTLTAKAISLLTRPHNGGR